MIRNESVVAMSAGAALAIPYLLYARRTLNRRRVFGIGLVVAAVVYAGFAAVGGTLQQLFIELSGVVLFAIFAFFGVRFSSYVLALGWVIHVSWDLLLHPIDVSSYAPWWYPVVCIGFDLVVAGAIVGASWHGPHGWTDRSRS